MKNRQIQAFSNVIMPLFLGTYGYFTGGIDNMNELAVQSRTTRQLSPLSGRIKEIDTLRGFAIFLVILAHAIIFFPINLHENVYCQKVFIWIALVNMPLFFVIAGFCFSCKDYKTYLRKKFQRLVIPYIVFNLIDMLPRQLLPPLVNRPRPITESLIHMLHGGEFWFIHTLFLIFLIYPLIYRLMNENKFRMILGSVLLFMVSRYGVHISFLRISSAIRFLFFFHVGVMARYVTGGKWPIKKIPAFVLPIMFALWLILLYGVGGFFLALVFIGIIICSLMTRYKLFNDIFSRFGEYSLQIYLMNGITLGISRAIICNVFHVTNPAIIVSFNVFFDLVVSYMLIKYIFSRSRLIRILRGME